jgi:hypothetical protein
MAFPHLRELQKCSLFPNPESRIPNPRYLNDSVH